MGYKLTKSLNLSRIPLKMKTEKQKMLDGELYLAGDPELAAERQKTRMLLHRMNVTQYYDMEAYPEIRSSLIPNSHPTTWLEPPFHCDYGYNIECGENTFFNFNCTVLDICKVTIGSRCLFAPNVQIYTATHPVDAKLRADQLEFGKPVTIGDDCWIGGGAIILPGVTIGDRVIVGAGAVVTKDVPSDSIVVGNPALPIKK